MTYCFAVLLLIVAAALFVLLFALKAESKGGSLLFLPIPIGLFFLGGWLTGSFWKKEERQVPRPPPSPPAQVSANPESLEYWQSKSQEWRKKHALQEDLLTKHNRIKLELVEKLKAQGVRSAADLKVKTKGRIVADELREVVMEIALIKRKYDESEESIERLDYQVRRYQRKLAIKEAGVSDEELANISKAIHELDERLNRISTEKSAVPDLEIEAVLDKELKLTNSP
jgi:ATPase subunit of ABC transporter with duplicated ATPase domains